MATLVGAADDSEADVVWTISEDVVDATEYFQVDDEIVQVLANFHSSIYAPTGETTPPKIRVKRGAGGTSTEAHDDGTTLTPVIPPSTGTGGTGETNVYVQPTDPGAVGAGKLWTTLEYGVPLQRRGPDDDIWGDLLEFYLALGAIELVARDAILRLQRRAADGVVIRAELAMEPGDTRIRANDEAGTLITEWEVSTDGLGAQVNDELGTQRVILESGAGDSGDTDARYELTIFNAASAMKAQLRLDETGVHFDGIVPEVPASPTEQDIVDALLALGLVTQAP